ncbi:MAG TPA: DUF1015 domain-containing protein [Actinomycetota bacterium]|nr:DUF1015 domain-containing protein [Actinomycetota bacterium]
MPRLSPFRGLVFDTAVTGPLDRVTAPPYDVISDRLRLGYLRASPFSVVHLDLAEGSEDPRDPASRYAKAAGLLADWERRGAVRRAGEACYYAYEMTPSRGGTSPVRGLICAMDLEEWGGTILPHEQVMDGPIRDRLALLRATRTHLSPVFGTIDGPDDRLDAWIGAAAAGRTAFEALDEQGVLHRMWPVHPDAVDLTHLADRFLLIADGHHRYATALAYRNERRRAEGPGPWDSVLTLVVDATAEHLPVLPFHRVQLAGPVPANGSPKPSLEETLGALDDERPTVGIATAGPGGEITYQVRSLDGEAPAVRALHEELLDEIAPAGSLRYTHDVAAAVAALRDGDAVAAYLLPPTTTRRIRAVVERGERLPPKSTYFWPKPRTGMVMMPLDRGPAPPKVRPRAS